MKDKNKSIDKKFQKDLINLEKHRKEFLSKLEQSLKKLINNSVSR